MLPPRSTLAAMAVMLTASQTVSGQGMHGGQDEQGHVPLRILERPLPLRDGIGKAHEGVTTSSADAQAYYDQGLAYLHSYVWIEAARSFNQALRLDAGLAMAYLGLSYALGELGELEGASQASRQASGLADRVTDLERLRINLRATQLIAAAQPDKPSIRSDYLKQFDEALMKYPKDVELLLLRGRTNDRTHEAPGMGSGVGSVAFYERALAQQPHYFAAHHYLTHAYENLGRTDVALAHAAEYARLAPAVPHAHHMYGHVLRRVNRMQDAIAEFRRADELELAYFQTERIAPQYDWHYHHNLDLLGASYKYTGQMRQAEAVLQRSFELPSIELSQELNEDAWPMFLLQQGRTEQALSATHALVSRSEPVVQALGHLLTSRVLMALNRMDEATKEGDQAIRQMREATLGGVLLPQLQLTQGEFLLRKGQTEPGRATLREAVAKLRSDPGSDISTQTLLRLEGVWRLSRDLGDRILAAEVANQMQQFDPTYAGTHYALATSADWQGNLATAQAEYKAALQGWSEADPDFGSLTAARHRLVVLKSSKRTEPSKWP
jgi:tetratricopeptide (TPR) repeat protein